MPSKPKCNITTYLSGPCMGCKKPMRPAHIGEDPLLGIATVLCAECCGCGETIIPAKNQ